MSIINVQDLIEDGTGISADNHPLLPQHTKGIGSSRVFISGRSGAGKTNVLISAILQGQLKFDHIYLYCKSPEQPKWRFFIQFLNRLELEYENENGEKLEFLTIRTKIDDIIPVNEIPSNRINIAIFDDLLTDTRQGDIITEYFTRSRHQNCSCYYITQVYHNKQLAEIRKNCDYFLIFGVSSKKELIVIGTTHSMDDRVQTFYNKFTQATENTHDFFLIDNRTTMKILKQRKNWTGVWNPFKERYEELDPVTLEVIQAP